MADGRVAELSKRSGTEILEQAINQVGWVSEIEFVFVCFVYMCGIVVVLSCLLLSFVCPACSAGPRHPLVHSTASEKGHRSTEKTNSETIRKQAGTNRRPYLYRLRVALVSPRVVVCRYLFALCGGVGVAAGWSHSPLLHSAAPFDCGLGWGNCWHRAVNETQLNRINEKTHHEGDIGQPTKKHQQQTQHTNIHTNERHRPCLTPLSSTRMV